MPEMPEGQTPEGEKEEPVSFSQEDMTRVRNEAKNRRLELREAERQVEDLTKKLKGYEDKSKSEVERITEEKMKLERDLADRDREMAEAALKAKVYAEASRLNIVDSEMAYLALDISSLDPDDPKGVQKALSSLVKDKPFLLKSAPPTPGAGGPPVQDKPGPEQQFLNLLKQGAKR